jgi:hypothetical protein
MTTSPKIEGTPDVPAEVFEQFLQALGRASAPAKLITRLRKTLLEDKTFNDRSLKAAILGEESQP